DRQYRPAARPDDHRGTEDRSGYGGPPPRHGRQPGGGRRGEERARRRQAALARRDRHERRGARTGDAALEGVRALSKLRRVLDAIKFEHTIFALPFAYIAMVLAARGWPGWWTVSWVTAAMVGGRTCAMGANRVIDRFIDAKNPRTAGRHLPTGLLGVGEMRALAIAGAVLMFVAAW